MDTVEHLAKISLVTEILGRQVLLSGSEVDKLLTVRQRYFGSGTPEIERTAVCPVTEVPQGTSISTQGVASGGRRADSAPDCRSDGAERFTVSREDLVAMVRE